MFRLFLISIIFILISIQSVSAGQDTDSLRRYCSYWALVAHDIQDTRAHGLSKDKLVEITKNTYALGGMNKYQYVRFMYALNFVHDQKAMPLDETYTKFNNACIQKLTKKEYI